MADQIAGGPERGSAPAGFEFESETPVLHIASPRDAAGERGRGARLRALLARGDQRDRAAERRDRIAEARSPADADPQARLDRDWAGRDRDAAAIDRADLLALFDAGAVAGQRSQP